MNIWSSGYLFFDALMLALVLSFIPLITALVVGICVSIVQTATQVQEQTISFVCKLCVLILVLWVVGPWMAEEVKNYTINALTHLSARSI